MTYDFARAEAVAGAWFEARDENGGIVLAKGAVVTRPYGWVFPEELASYWPTSRCPRCAREFFNAMVRECPDCRVLLTALSVDL